MVNIVLAQGEEYFVAVWDPDGPEQGVRCVIPWKEWARIPIGDRPFHVTVVKGKDELDAFRRAERGEDVFRGN